MAKISTSQSRIEIFVLVFLHTLSDILGTLVDRDILMSSLGTNQMDVLFYGHH